jgi:hypothetical protein
MRWVGWLSPRVQGDCPPPPKFPPSSELQARVSSEKSSRPAQLQNDEEKRQHVANLNYALAWQRSPRGVVAQGK